ncbi:hypothetical protein HDU98_003021 [Podochytrium sp. JEL0797]|nr:hypothetical protein HDU98_003021 [Podochytrium sp. JEL0797]
MPNTPRLFFSITRHARLVPRSHKFVFPVVFAALNLSAKHKNSLWFSRNSWGLLSLWDKDYLSKGETDLRQSVLQKLKDANTALPRPVARIELVTAPRFFGIPSFNPLSVYYCFDNDGVLLAALLEVNNTFGERHVYVCDTRNRWENAKPGFHSSYTLDRSFFVSPFNNRSGVYETHLAKLTATKMGVLLIIKDYSPDPNELKSEVGSTATQPGEMAPSKHLIASVEGDSVPLTPLTVLCLLFFHPLTVFLTLPRIMVEAWKIAYVKRLGIYQKPNPQRTPALAGRGTTILPLPATPFDTFCRDMVLKHLVNQCHLHSTTLHLTFADQTNPLSVSAHGVIHAEPEEVPESKTGIHIRLLSPYLFTRLVTDFHNPSRALCTTFLSGDWSAFKKQDLTRFLHLLSVKQPQESTYRPASASSFWKSAAFWINSIHHPPTKSKTAAFPPFITRLDGEFEIARLNVTQVSEDGWKRVFWGTAETLLSEWAFLSVTRFIVDPYKVADRVETLYSPGLRGGVDEGAGAGEETEGALLGEVGDEVDGFEREKKRLRILWSSVQ